jgi:isoamylase
MTTALEREHRSTLPESSPLFTRGSSSPLGATPSPEGVNFSVFSKHATAVESCSSITSTTRVRRA